MGSEASTSTTAPSESTEQIDARARIRCVRWVFPRGSSTSVEEGIHVVGRENSADTVLEGDHISRQHAEFRIDGPVFSVRDLKSRNGLFVNGVKRSDSVLALGDVVRCGEWVGVVVAEGNLGELHEISPGWFGGRMLAAALAPARGAATDLPVILQGETGTGKEGAAQAIHTWSKRTGKFVALNCAALPPHLLDSELFGYRRGAFTDAKEENPGFFRAAHEGTLFLDEIVELPREAQAKMLRALEQREVVSLGSPRPIPIDVRVIVASHESLTAAVAQKRFRDDLFARLDGLTVVLPPLRGRREDIVPLFKKLLQRELRKQHAGAVGPEIDVGFAEALVTYDWPHNVRELDRLARAMISAHGGENVLKKAHLPEKVLARPSDAPAFAVPPPKSRRRNRPTNDATQFEALVAALKKNKGSVPLAAEAMGISDDRAYRLLKSHPEFSLNSVRG